MLFYPYLALYLLCGILSVTWLLPGQRVLIRLWLGSALGLFYLMWLPALAAFLWRFSMTGHLLALLPLSGLTLAAFILRDRGRALRPFGDEDKKDIRLLLFLALPLTILSAVLQYTHNLRPQDGALYVGQSTYGDLALHTGIITSLQNARFPADYSILPGARLSYPFLADSLSTTGLIMGLNLQSALNITGTLMLSLVFSGYTLLAARMADSRRAAALAVLLLFINGGLGFMYSFDMMGESLGATGSNELQMGTWLDRLRTIMNGWYQTPVNHAEFGTYNLRWSNIIADMLTPQRTFLAGWVFLIPCLYLLFDGLREEKRNPRAFLLLGLIAGGLPLIHTHSFLALGLLSAGWLVWEIFSRRDIKPFVLYGALAVTLALPQLVGFTFRQSGGEGFVRFQFNWVNNPGGHGLRDGYLWFYIKNIGLPFILLLLSLFERNRKHRFIYSGAFVIFLAAELILFQPNEYDNNKLFYVWYALCLPAVSGFAFSLWERLKGLRARPLIGMAACLVFFLSGSLSIAREFVGSYQAYAPPGVAVANYVREETEEHSVFMTSYDNHLNPISALAGRTIVCGPSLWLHWHGFDLSERQQDIRAYYGDPQANEHLLKKYDVDYILVGPDERRLAQADDALFSQMYEPVYTDENREYTIYKVPG